MEIALNIVFSIGFAGVVLWLFKLNQLNLTVKGARLIFALALIIGALLCQTATHLFYFCDSNGKCGYTWGDPFLKATK